MAETIEQIGCLPHPNCLGAKALVEAVDSEPSGAEMTLFEEVRQYVNEEEHQCRFTSDGCCKVVDYLAQRAVVGTIYDEAWSGMER